MAVRGYCDEGRVNVGAFVPVDLKRELVEVAYAENETLSQIIRDALADRVARARDIEPAALPR